MKIIRPVQVTQSGSFTRNSTATYWDSNGVLQTASANALRITYAPSDLTKAPYALVEPTATNSALYSDQFDNVNWTASNCAASSAGVAGPTGNLAYSLVGSSGNSNRYLASTPVTATNSTFSVSVFAKAGAFNYLKLSLTNFSTESGGAVFNLRDGLITSVDADQVDFTGLSAKICAVGNGWYRCSLTGAKGSVNNVVRFAMVSMDNTLTMNGNGTSGVYINGAQFELGSTVSSYIPTTSIAGTRAADVVTSSGLLYSNIPEADYLAWNSATAYVSGDRVLDVANHKVYVAVGGVRNVITIPAASTAFSMVDANNASIVPALGTTVKLSTTGTLPSGFATNTTYYVVSPTTTTFGLSTTSGGAAISSGTAGTGVYTLTTQANTNKPLNDTANWLLAGMDNRWSMFDQSITSQSSQAGSIMIAFAPGQRIDSLIGLNCVGNKAKVTVVDTVSGQLAYSSTLALAATSGITDLYRYLFEPIVQLPDFVLDDIPLGISNTSIVVFTISSTATAMVGGLVFGLSKDIGLTEWGAKVSTVDYSVKTQDAFGNYTVTPRAFSKKGDFTVRVPTDSVDFLQNLLAQYRALPVVYIGYNSGGRTKFNSTVIYGFYKDFSIDIGYGGFSVCSMTVEGLT